MPTARKFLKIGNRTATPSCNYAATQGPEIQGPATRDQVGCHPKRPANRFPLGISAILSNSWSGRFMSIRIQARFEGIHSAPEIAPTSPPLMLCFSALTKTLFRTICLAFDSRQSSYNLSNLAALPQHRHANHKTASPRPTRTTQATSEVRGACVCWKQLHHQPHASPHARFSSASNESCQQASSRGTQFNCFHLISWGMQ